MGTLLPTPTGTTDVGLPQLLGTPLPGVPLPGNFAGEPLPVEVPCPRDFD